MGLNQPRNGSYLNFPVVQKSTVDSTNSEALRCLQAGTAAPFLLVANEQTRGRGRSGKGWLSPPGNFYGTFAVTVDRPAFVMAQVSFVAAVALAQVLRDLDLEPQLKWPNDVLIDGAKISGILLEKYVSVLLIGMGVNLMHHPNQVGYDSVSLKDLGLDLEIESMATYLGMAFSQKFHLWSKEGFEPIRQAWIDQAFGLGQALEVRLPGREAITGIFEGLACDGALQLDTENGLRLLHAGEVYFHAARH